MNKISYIENKAKLVDLSRSAELLRQIEQPLFLLDAGQQVDLVGALPQGVSPSGMLPVVPLTALGSAAFRARYGLKYALYGGAMANGIASEDMVIALGKAGMMGSFGAAGLSPARVETGIQKVQAALPQGPYLFNLISSPGETGLEAKLVELYLQYGVNTIEASAFVSITEPLVYYRASGLIQAPDGSVTIGHRVVAKLSRVEVAKRFMEPAPQDILKRLVEAKKITPEQAELAAKVPMTDDVTVEADSGGHTDNRPLVSMIPPMLHLRDQIQAERHYAEPVGIGAAGGISTPEGALAAFALGADYVVTGSVNQACVESGTSPKVKQLLAQAATTDVAMAPAADMFEMGVRVQVLKRGTLFAPRAQKLYELYSRYNSVEELPEAEKEKLEKQIFKRSLEDIWQETVSFFSQRDPQQLERAQADPHYKLALIFRWYLGLSSRWAVTAEPGREMDYQIWCGPSLGAFNDWSRGTYLEQPANRHVADVALQILTGAAYLARIRLLELYGVELPAELRSYRPEKPIT
jgi:PfaD family protein